MPRKTLSAVTAIVLAALPAGRQLDATPPAPAAEEYPTTCQWNNCPRPGDAECLVAWNGHYICTRPIVV